VGNIFGSEVGATFCQEMCAEIVHALNLLR
jgi:hypothetical protein